MAKSGGEIYHLFLFFEVMKTTKKVDAVSYGFFSFNPLSVRIFTVFGRSLLEDGVLHKEAWVEKLLGTRLSIQVHKKVKFSLRDNSSLALKGLKQEKLSILYLLYLYHFFFNL